MGIALALALAVAITGPSGEAGYGVSEMSGAWSEAGVGNFSYAASGSSDMSGAWSQAGVGNFSYAAVGSSEMSGAWSEAGVGAPFPSNIPGLALWLRADLGVTISSGTSVSYWADQSGNGNDFAQASSGNQPTYSASAGPGGVPSLLFTRSSSQFLSRAISASLSPTAGITVAAIIQTGTALHNYQAVFTTNNTAATSGYMMASGPAGAPSEFEFAVNAYVSDYGGGGAGTILISTAYEMTGVYDGSHVTLYKNGSQVGTQTAYSSAISYAGAGGGTIYVGAGNGWTDWDGYISEILVWPRGLTSGELTTLHNNLNARYGV